MINSKLYKKYYPIISVNDKEIFISDNLLKIHGLLKKRKMLNLNTIIKIEKEYDKRLKKVWSILGNIRPGNIIYNKYVEQEKTHDYHLVKISKCNDILKELEIKLVYNSLTIEDANTILRIDNKQFRENISVLITGLVFSVVLLLIYTNKLAIW